MSRRIKFTCKDCGEDVDREPNTMDRPGYTPARCVSCTLDRMAEL
jgi:endogenous inhibitor of DNA gyrase (YacG/DUF329 family)